MSGFKPFDPNSSGGGGGNLPTFTPPESPFVNDAALDVWAAANLDLLYNGDSVFSFTLVESNSIAMRWSGENQPAAYDSGFWIDIGAGGVSLDQELLIYVAKAGNDSSSGLNVNNPKLTISAAIVDALLLTPSSLNQITIDVLDTGTYTESPNLPEWVHIDAQNAALNGRLTVSDSTISRFRRLQNSTDTQPIVRKTDGTGFARITCDLMIVEGATQEGVLVNNGLVHIDAGVLDVDAGVGIKAKNGARVSFIIPEILLKNGALGIGTRTAGGDPNFTSGIISEAIDTDNTCTLVEAKVTGDVINIQGGSFTANTLYNMGAGTTLNIFATEATGSTTADPEAVINSTLAGGLPFTITTTDLLIESSIKDVYVDSSANPIILTLGDHPRDGEHKLIYIGHNENLITLNSVNPSFPIGDVPIIAEANVQGMWAMSGDFLDRFTTGRDLTMQGTGGSFVADVVQGRNVLVFDTEGTAELQAIGYDGILGNTFRSFTTWIGWNALPTEDQYITSWGSDNSGGQSWLLFFVFANQEIRVSIRNAYRTWSLADLNAVNFFDGNMHHLALTQSGTGIASSRLFIDGVEVPNSTGDNNPNMNTIAEFDYGISKSLTGSNPLNARLYDARLFDKALSPAEIEAVYNDNITGGITLSGFHDTVFDVVFTGTEWQVSIGTQLQLLAISSRVDEIDNRPTVSQSLTAPTFNDARFFSGFGLADTQGWVITANIPATVTIVTETVDGIPQAVHKLFDDGSGIATVGRALTAEDWTNIFALDASFGGPIRLDSTAGDNGCFWGLGCLAADSPDSSPDKRRFGINAVKSATTNELRVFGTDGNTMDVDVAGTSFDSYNDINVKITRGSPPTAEVFVNGDLIGTLDFLVHVGGTGTECSWSSGSSGGTERVTYMPDFGVTIYTSENVVTIGDDELNVDNARILLPPGNRDYTFIFSEDITGSDIGAQFEFTGLNTGGTFTATNENLSNPKALFNALPTVTIPTTGTPVLGVQSVEGGNAYEFALPESPFNATTDISVDRVLEAISLAVSQEPTGLGIANAVQVEFGAAQFTGSDPVSMDVNGAVTFNQGGMYRVKSVFQFGRTGASGTSELLFRLLVNGVQLGRSVGVKLGNSDDLDYIDIDNWFNVPAGTILTTEIMRDPGGNNSGGIFKTTPTNEGAGTWSDVPCTILRIERWASP